MKTYSLIVCVPLLNTGQPHICPEESRYITALCESHQTWCVLFSLSLTHTLFHLPNAQVKHKQKGTCPLGSACVLEIRHVDRATEPSARPFCRREAGYMTILREPLYKGCHLTLSSCGAFTPHRVRREWVFTRLSPSSSALVSLALPLLRCLVFQLTSVGSVVLRRPVSREQAGTLEDRKKVSSAVQLWLAPYLPAPRCPPLPCGSWTGSFHSTLPWWNSPAVWGASECVCVAEVALLTYWCWNQF